MAVINRLRNSFTPTDFSPSDKRELERHKTEHKFQEPNALLKQARIMSNGCYVIENEPIRTALIRRRLTNNLKSTQ